MNPFMRYPAQSIDCERLTTSVQLDTENGVYGVYTLIIRCDLNAFRLRNEFKRAIKLSISKQTN